MRCITPWLCVAFLLCSTWTMSRVFGQTQAEPAAKKIELFNGKDLSNFDYDPRLWSVRDGVIHGETTAENAAKGNTFLIWKDGVVRDFTLRFQFRLNATNNSGVQYRSRRIGTNASNDWAVRGYQHEIRNQNQLPDVSGFLYDEGGKRNRLCLVGEKARWTESGKELQEIFLTQHQYEQLFKLDDWNEAVIVANGPRIQHFVNGTKVLDFQDEHPELALREGIVAFQLHAGKPMWVEYRNIELEPKPLMLAQPLAKPIKVLLVTGGCCHDYEFQTKAMQLAAQERGVAIDWTVINEGGKGTKAMIPLYENADWAKDFDLVIHNECFADTDDTEYIRRITKAHADGANAIVIHCAMHTYRKAEIDDWREFLGVTSRKHDHQSHYPIKVVEPTHPAMQFIPPGYKSAKDELYIIEKVWPNTRVLATSTSENNQEEQAVFWTNQYGKARVFGTTYGHSNETFSDPVFLDALIRGMVWAATGS